MCFPFVGSSSPTAGRESWLMVLVDHNRVRCTSGKCVRSLLFILYTSEMFVLVENILYTLTDNSTALAVVRKPADRFIVAASLNRDLAGIGVVQSLVHDTKS